MFAKSFPSQERHAGQDRILALPSEPSLYTVARYIVVICSFFFLSISLQKMEESRPRARETDIDEDGWALADTHNAKWDVNELCSVHPSVITRFLVRKPQLHELEEEGIENDEGLRGPFPPLEKKPLSCSLKGR